MIFYIFAKQNYQRLYIVFDYVTLSVKYLLYRPTMDTIIRMFSEVRMATLETWIHSSSYARPGAYVWIYNRIKAWSSKDSGDFNI